MRKALTILFAILLVGAPAFAGTCGNGYTYSLKFTVPVANNPTADQTNFPVALAFNGAHFFNSYYLPDLKTVANSGKIQNTANNSISVSGPADLIFCDAASAGNALKFELSGYSATTGALEAYVKVATLSHTTANNFWMFYGNAAVVTSQQDLSLWSDGGYSFVSHLSDGTTLTPKDSTGSATLTNNSATAVSGAIDGAAAFNGTTQYISSNSPVSATTVTLEGWAYPTANMSVGRIVDNLDGSAHNGYTLFLGAAGTNTKPEIYAGGASAGQDVWSNTNLDTNLWSYVLGTWTGTTGTIYLNAVNVTDNTFGTNGITASSSNLAIGRSSSGSGFFSGSLDEIRISPSVRSSTWITETYANEQSPSSFALANTQTPATGVRIVQYNSCDSAISTANTCTFPANVSSGNLLIVVSANADSAKCTNGNINTLFSDTRSSTFTYAILGDNVSGGHPTACIAFATLGSSGAESITAAANASNSQSMMIYEIASVTSTSLDVTSINTGGASGTLSTGSATATTANSILVCGFGGSSSGNSPYTSSISPSGGFLLNRISAPIALGATKGGTAFIQFTGSGSKSCTFTFGGAGPTNTAGALAVIKYSPSGVASKRRQSQVY